jgi:hypothetical protein
LELLTDFVNESRDNILDSWAEDNDVSEEDFVELANLQVKVVTIVENDDDDEDLFEEDLEFEDEDEESDMEDEEEFLGI